MDLIDATTVFPGKRDGVHLAQLPVPNISGVPNDRGVLITVLRCGVDGTDPAISNAEYGATRRRQPRLKLSNVFRAEKKQWQRKRLVRRPENGSPWI